jgi:hypothetical protein
LVLWRMRFLNLSFTQIVTLVKMKELRTIKSEVTIQSILEKGFLTAILLSKS